MIEITAAETKDFDKVRAFYYSMIDAMENAEYGPGWKKGVYPADEYMQSSIERGELFLGMVGDEIAAAMIVNHDCNESYSDVDWPTPAKPHETTVIHALGVHPDFGGRGYAKELVRWVIARANADGQRVIRLDVLEGNIPAERLYTGLGFKYVATAPMFYEDTGWTNYIVYEFLLSL